MSTAKRDSTWHTAGQWTRLQWRHHVWVLAWTTASHQRSVPPEWWTHREEYRLSAEWDVVGRRCFLWTYVNWRSYPTARKTQVILKWSNCTFWNAIVSLIVLLENKLQQRRLLNDLQLDDARHCTSWRQPRLTTVMLRLAAWSRSRVRLVSSSQRQRRTQSPSCVTTFRGTWPKTTSVNVCKHIEILPINTRNHVLNGRYWILSLFCYQLWNFQHWRF